MEFIISWTFSQSWVLKNLPNLYWANVEVAAKHSVMEVFLGLFSFTALNVAKIMCKELGTSIGRLKAKMINAYYAQRIIDVFDKSPNTPLNKERVNDIFSFAADVA